MIYLEIIEPFHSEPYTSLLIVTCQPTQQFRNCPFYSHLACQFDFRDSNVRTKPSKGLLAGSLFEINSYQIKKSVCVGIRADQSELSWQHKRVHTFKIVKVSAMKPGLQQTMYWFQFGCIASYNILYIHIIYFCLVTAYLADYKHACTFTWQRNQHSP